MTETPEDGQRWRVTRRSGFWWVQVPWSGGWDDRYRCYYEADADTIIADHGAALALARAKAALEEYGQHLAPCPQWDAVFEAPPCMCGLAGALASLEGE